MSQIKKKRGYIIQPFQKSLQYFYVLYLYIYKNNLIMQSRDLLLLIGVNKKIKKSIKLKKPNHEKKLIAPIKILKKPTCSAQFISLKPKKQNRTQTKKN